MAPLLTAVVGALVVGAIPAFAAVAQSFSPPSTSPLVPSGNYTGKNNGTIVNSPVVPGKSFDRFIQIWLENTDFNTAASSAVFQNLAKQGLLMTSYYGVTHPSEPNYIAAAGGDFFGCMSDNLFDLPSNISTIVDLLEAKNISWASYQESMPYDGFTGFNYTEKNYLNASSGNYVYYVRKHNPTIIFDSVANVTSRAMRHRNFNDFAVDVSNNSLPQWMFVTPNLVNDAHDTTIDFVSQWLNFWLVPLLADQRFNNNRTLILLTFDETETYTINNQIWTLAIGGGLPSNLVGQTDDTYYTHYSALSTVEANWGLGSLGRQDTNKTVSNVYSWVASATGYTNNGLTGNSTLPLTNLTGIFPGPLNTGIWTPALAPNVSAVGAGGGPVHQRPGLNPQLTSFAAMNLTALNITNPDTQGSGVDYPNGTPLVAAAAASTSAKASGSGSAPASQTSAKSSAARTYAGPALGLLFLVAAIAF